MAFDEHTFDGLDRFVTGDMREPRRSDDVAGRVNSGLARFVAIVGLM
jgi:hypothetical protein